MLFIFYLIRKCNLIWRWWSGCVCMRVCARGSVCIQWVNRWAGGVRGWSDREPNEPGSLFLSLSLSFSPSWGTEFESECKTKSVDCVLIFLTLERYLSAASQPNTPKPSRPAVFQTSNHAWVNKVWNLFDLQSSEWIWRFTKHFFLKFFEFFKFCLNLIYLLWRCGHIESKVISCLLFEQKTTELL